MPRLGIHTFVWTPAWDRKGAELCIKNAVKAKLDGAKEWIKASDRAYRAARHAEAEATECASRAKTLMEEASAAMAACSAEGVG